MTEPLVWVDDRGQDVTVVAFSGLAQTHRIFEWTKSVAEFSANFIGVQDVSRRWYQLGTDRFAYAAREAVSKVGGKRIIVLGASAGGFAAFLFGRFLGADLILALSPQSACGGVKRALGDNRWPQKCLPTPSCDVAGHYPEAIVHVAADEPLDVLHAKRLRPGRLIVHARGGHNLPSALKESGDLRLILEAAIAG